jgi:hypothetical protein
VTGCRSISVSVAVDLADCVSCYKFFMYLYAKCHTCMPSVIHVCQVSYMYAKCHTCMPSVIHVCQVAYMCAK